ncbi:BUD22 family protein C4F10.06 [Grifola frondosa]|uniref:BUD22 family protein C4F10.06 n=1 Tax=Grifola frondosa TaxID=5627 RepID=A0A1C7LVK9_GRIFR|nr:BUD22 family protein C4F10.06 [Grifola frondosa]
MHEGAAVELPKAAIYDHLSTWHLCIFTSLHHLSLSSFVVYNAWPKFRRSSQARSQEEEGFQREERATWAIALQAQGPLAENLSKKLHHGLREVRKAAKKAKTFELRKLVKRLKDLRKKDAASEGIEDLEKQLEVMKDIDHECIGATALKTKIQKDHLLSGHPDVQTAIAVTLSVNLLKPSAPGSPAAKVESRILSSKTLAVDVLAVVDALKEVIQPKKKEAVVDGGDNGEDDEEEQEEEVEVRPKKSKKAAVSAPAAQDEDGSEGDSEDTEADNEEEAGWESGSVQENAEDGGGWESGSVDDSHPGVATTEDETSALEAEDDDVDEESDAPAPPAKKTRRAPASDAKGKTKAAGVASTFLPSLAVGFTRGDSDVSDWSDGEPDVAEPRKNRRGQRARRAIWEKKYGKNANHVKKEAAEGPRQNIARGRDDKHGKGSRVRLGAPSAGSRSQFKAPSADGGWPKKTSSAAENASRGHAPEKDKEEKPLHPSWEAKRRLKEKLNPSILPAQGKKIVF